MDPAAFLRSAARAPWYRGQLAHVEYLPARPARHRDLPRRLAPELQRNLERAGAWPLYSHQVEAIAALDRGEHVVVPTGAASGKSLCYHIPVLEALLTDRNACALYLFPTKALAQDQLRGIGALAPPAGRVRAATFDGDTPREERAWAKRSAQLLITNPDMLHLGMLPNHRSWNRLLRRLRYVVLDESHVYRGVFGSHVAMVMRRLRRLCRVYGSRPRFVLASATIANPDEHAAELTGLRHTVVTEDGAPASAKGFALWNPPLLDGSSAGRRSASAEATVLFTELARRGVRSVAFVRTRRLAELLSRYTRDNLERVAPELASRVAAYRAGYLAEERRALEQALFDGRLLAVATTNALELGIDIGDLDATLLVGYPGSIASTWQQAGRSGRRGDSSLSVLVAQDNPLDQYLVRHPQAIFGQPTEAARISVTNPRILEPHLVCAAYEAPLGGRDADLFGHDLAERAARLAEQGLLQRRGGERWFPDPRAGYPAEQVNIRSTSLRTFTVVDRESGRILETVDEASAFHEVHPGAIYLHQGEAYHVSNLDLGARVAYASQSGAQYHTRTREFTDVRILDTARQKRAGTVMAYLGDVEVSSTVVGYRRQANYTEEILGEEELRLPPRVFRTSALWFDAPEETVSEIRRRREDLPGGLHAAEHAAIGVLPLFALCDRNDLGGLSTPLHPDTGRPEVIVYDGHPGGVGIAERGFEVIGELWEATLSAVEECACQDGCPGCIQSPKCGNNNQGLDKAVGVKLLRALLGRRG